MLANKKRKKMADDELEEIRVDDQEEPERPKRFLFQVADSYRVV